eukprot:TRINITY_DN224_c0_g1_i4.p1 TRINITY_DN224_c0_g1~~TRINITY_DN224_c0_g1_i4.p1  ORF type:complete len:155 (-),score=118.82 TRINITY_DN224_c0_g1_i4:121-585(-)
MALWRQARGNLRYAYLESERKRLEEGAAERGYAGVMSERSGEDESLLLRRADILLSDDVTSSVGPSVSSSEFGNREQSSTSGSEVGRTTTESSESELGVASGGSDRPARAAESSSSSSSAGAAGAAAGNDDESSELSSSVSSTLSSTLSSTGSA